MKIGEFYFNFNEYPNMSLKEKPQNIIPSS